MVDSQATHDAMRYLSQESWFRWACDDPHEIEAWGNLQLVESRTFLDASPDLMKHVPWQMRLFAQWAPWLIRKKVEGYRLNRFVVAPD
ncbi:MAG: hypothetical protein ACFB12_16750 [Leptolyngbyaceae cyanobacterium]